MKSFAPPPLHFAEFLIHILVFYMNEARGITELGKEILER